MSSPVLHPLRTSGDDIGGDGAERDRPLTTRDMVIAIGAAMNDALGAALDHEVRTGRVSAVYGHQYRALLAARDFILSQPAVTDSAQPPHHCRAQAPGDGDQAAASETSRSDAAAASLREGA